VLEKHDEITFPHAIKATDAEGRSYTYLALGPEWRQVKITKIDHERKKQKAPTDSPKRARRSVLI
jgi:hypothetical protein